MPDEKIELKEAPAEAPKDDFTAKFDPDGWLRIEINFLAAVADNAKLHLMSGWMDHVRDLAKARVYQIRAQAEKEKQVITGLQNKNGFRRFVDGLSRR